MCGRNWSCISQIWLQIRFWALFWHCGVVLSLILQYGIDFSFCNFCIWYKKYFLLMFGVLFPQHHKHLCDFVSTSQTLLVKTFYICFLESDFALDLNSPWPPLDPIWHSSCASFFSFCISQWLLQHTVGGLTNGNQKLPVFILL